MSTKVGDEIYLQDAPAVPGLVFRHFRGAEDYPKMAAVIASSAEADHIERVTTPEEIANTYEHLVNCNPYTDMLFAEVDGQVVGYARSDWYQEGSGERLRQYLTIGFLNPQWRRKGIGSAMLHFLQGRLREIASGHPQDGPRYFQGYVDQHETGTQAMLEKEGYEVVRYFYQMVRPDLENIPTLPLPEGLEVRPALPEHYRQIWEADVEAFRDHWGYVEPKEEDYQHWLNDKVVFQPELWKIAWDGDQVAGQVRGYISHAENEEYKRKRGWCEFISVRRPWRKRGLARALMALTLEEFKRRGMEESALGVDTENLSGALRVYESMGFRPVQRSSAYRKAF
jgi:GNAT superfamily N-acetyltransferase